MADFVEVLKERRSIRKYEDKDVPEDVLLQVLEAVKWSPSWTNSQCWEVIVIRDQTIKERLQATLPKGNPASKAVVQAPVLLALCGKLETSGYYKNQASTKFGDWFMYDLCIANQSLSLAAQNLGLGTVTVGLFDHDAAKAVVNVPTGYELVSLIPVGYPAKRSSAPKRREVSEFTHYETF